MKTNGWFLDILHSDSPPSRFKLEGSSNGIDWALAGASQRRFVHIAFIKLDWTFRPDLPFLPSSCDAACADMPTATCCALADGGRRLLFDHRFSWAMLLSPTINFILFASMLTFSVLGFAARHAPTSLLARLSL
eukprot:CAMPEP_0113675996 /NCGR_PEP_ID=MMETSP0038_2-20120614/8380_1 /TAXON_ID=2898 /ORGANISM="Cryptomonas paramecium" /LENGTH=133 /DNA_ID=CAMNT_0000592941 /DNA_START=454 /DNA_END=851 /DNA_ORIENTATION=+ /assembly_acc=CAM_ASM_000170